MNNFLAPEIPTIQRLQQEVSELKRVCSASAWSAYQDIGPMLPAAIVRQVPRAQAGDSDPGDAAAQWVRQYWEVCVAVPHQEDVIGGDFETSAKQAGELLYKIARALIGWRPAEGWQKFAFYDQDGAYYEPGYGEFPALFQTGFLITGS